MTWVSITNLSHFLYFKYITFNGIKNLIPNTFLRQFKTEGYLNEFI